MGSPRRRSSPWPLVLFSVLLLAAPSSVTQKVRLTALSGFLPVRAGILWGVGLWGRFFPGAGVARSLAERNELLEDENRRQQGEIRRLQSELDQALGLKQAVRDRNYRMRIADVIFPTDSSPWRKSLTLAVGTADGVEKGMLVVHNSQVVGRVVEAASRTSRVQTVTDPGFRAGAIVVGASTAPGAPQGERRPGVYKGTAGPNGLVKWLADEASVECGAWVVTTEDPVNGVPRGLCLGSISSVNRGRGASPEIEVEPRINLRALEHVMVLVPPPEPRGASPGGRP